MRGPNSGPPGNRAGYHPKGDELHLLGEFVFGEVSQRLICLDVKPGVWVVPDRHVTGAES
jgi:hypothetical protein